MQCIIDDVYNFDKFHSAAISFLNTRNRELKGLPNMTLFHTAILLSSLVSLGYCENFEVQTDSGNCGNLQGSWKFDVTYGRPTDCQGHFHYDYVFEVCF